MAKSFGGAIKLKGESEYIKALRNIKQNLTLLSSEMGVVESAYAKNDTSTEACIARNESLTKILEEQKNKYNAIKSALADFNRQQEISTDEHAKLVAKLEEESRKLEDLKGDHSATSEQIEAQTKKVKALEVEVGKSSETLSKNSQKIQKHQIDLNKSQTEINNTTSKLEQNTEQIRKNGRAFDEGSKDVADFAGQLGKAEKNASRFGDILKASLLSDAIKTGVSGLVAGAKKLTEGLFDIGRQALESYADYEQLTGGIETLFKESASTVQGYAEVAFRTAGLSANEYMETVTSFSASLIASLDGDTKKAGDLANQAIIDMSDNANKMGTDMASIQNAYQGFAKGNYTMLDNLKLGYGGTAREMARLVNESGVLGDVQIDLEDTANLGKALNEVGFDTIIEAIHAVQTEMGITGTTALEASETIAGSIGAVKGAWQNLVTGLADENADFEGLVNNFVDSVMVAEENLFPRLEVILDGIVNLIGTLGERLLENLPAITAKGTELLQSLLDGVSSAIPEGLPVIVEVVNSLVDFISDNIGTIVDVGIKLLVAIAEGMLKGIPNLIANIPQILSSVTSSLLKGIGDMARVGRDLLRGLFEGLLSPSIIAEKIKSMGDSIMNKVKSFFGIHSPSKLMHDEVGTYLGEGMGEGMTDGFVNGEWWSSFRNGFERVVKLIVDLGKKAFGADGEFGAVIEEARTSFDTLLANMTNSDTDFSVFADDFVGKAMTAFREALPRLQTFIMNAVELADTIANAVTENLPEIIEAGVQLVLALASGIGDNLEILVPKMVEAVLIIVEGLLENIDKIIEAGIEIVKGLIGGIVKAIPILLDHLPTIIEGIVDGLLEGIPLLIEAGVQLAMGLFEGLLNPENIWKAVKGLFNGIIGGIKSIFGIHSPSTVMADEIGKNLSLGLGRGFVSEMGNVRDQMARAVPTDFAITATAIPTYSDASRYDEMVSAFKDALTDVRVVLDEDQMGAFVTNTIERVVYS